MKHCTLGVSQRLMNRGSVNEIGGDSSNDAGDTKIDLRLSMHIPSNTETENSFQM